MSNDFAKYDVLGERKISGSILKFTACACEAASATVVTQENVGGAPRADDPGEVATPTTNKPSMDAP